VLVAPNATRLALAGDFNGWSRTATPMTPRADGAWTATLALAPGAHRYAFVVDGTRAVADPTTPAARDTSDGARSVLTVPTVRD
jgi:1,4-alpha-glucan branching enzyme